MLNKQKMLVVGMMLLLVLMITPVVMAQMMSAVTVSDQSIENGTVTVDMVTSEGPGWIVIHADDVGQPGAVLGQTAVSDGENENVVVELATELTTPILFAMLHNDAGQEGVYEFPGEDTPVTVDDQIVMQSFEVTGGFPEVPVEEVLETPEELPETGGVNTPWMIIGLLLAGVLLLGSGLALARRFA